MQAYNPASWCWYVGGDKSKVWSSSAAAYLPVTDPVIAAWLDTGSTPSSILDERELVEVLGNVGLVQLAPTPSPSPTDLVAYATRHRDALLNGGMTVEVGTAAAPRVLSVDTTGNGRANILGLQKLNDFGHDIVWIESTGPSTLMRAQLDKLGEAAGLFIGAVYVAWANVLKEIGGSIETVADIDAFAWPSAAA